MEQIKETNNSILKVKERSITLNDSFKNFLEKFRKVSNYLISTEKEIVDVANAKSIYPIQKLIYIYEALKLKLYENNFDLDGDVLIDDKEFGIKVIIGFIQETKNYEIKCMIDREKFSNSFKLNNN